MRPIAKHIPDIAFDFGGKLKPLNESRVLASYLKTIAIQILGKKGAIRQFKKCCFSQTSRTQRVIHINITGWITILHHLIDE